MNPATVSDYESKPQKKKVGTYLKEEIFRRVPILVWFPHYDWRHYFVPDLFAGITCGVLHIPQGLAFALLARAPPIMGLYTSSFAVLIFCLFGNAPVSSYGPAAVCSILTGAAVLGYDGPPHSNVELIVAITLLVGIYYLGAYIVRLYVVTLLFTKPLTGGFIMAAALDVIVKGFRQMLGIKAKDNRGRFGLIYNVYGLFANIKTVNLVSLGISFSALFIFLLNLFVFKPLIRKVTKIILPIEAVVVTIAILLSYFLDLGSYDVELIGFVPTGFPSVTVPNYEVFSYLWDSALVIAVVNFSISMSTTMMFNKNMDTKQELLALSISNIVCCFFQCLPFGNSMMRTAIAQSLDIKTLLASVIASIFVLIVVLVAGPIFEPLPNCVLGSIIVFGMSVLFTSKAKTVPGIFKSGWQDFAIWVVTFLVGVFVSVNDSLLVGLVLTFRQNMAAQQAKQRAAAEEAQNQQQLPEGQSLLTSPKNLP